MIRIIKDEKTFFENLNSLVFIYGCTKLGRYLAELLKKVGKKVCFVDQFISAKGKDYFGDCVMGLDEVLTSESRDDCFNMILTVNDYDSVLLYLFQLNTNIRINVLTPKKKGNKYIKSNILLSPLRKQLLKRTDISIISNNCSDMLMYNALGIKPRSPFIGAGMTPEDFLKLAQDFEYYLKQELIYDGYEYKGVAIDSKAIYPIGKLGDLRLFFVHYNNWNVVTKLWENQIKKVNTKAIYWIFSDFQEVLKYSIVKEFSELKINKCILLSKSMYSLPGGGINYLKEEYGSFLDEITIIEEWFDLVGWINNEWSL